MDEKPIIDLTGDGENMRDQLPPFNQIKLESPSELFDPERYNTGRYGTRPPLTSIISSVLNNATYNPHAAGTSFKSKRVDYWTTIVNDQSVQMEAIRGDLMQLNHRCSQDCKSTVSHVRQSNLAINEARAEITSQNTQIVSLKQIIETMSSIITVMDRRIPTLESSKSNLQPSYLSSSPYVDLSHNAVATVQNTLLLNQPNEQNHQQYEAGNCQQQMYYQNAAPTTLMPTLKVVLDSVGISSSSCQNDDVVIPTSMAGINCADEITFHNVTADTEKEVNQMLTTVHHSFTLPSATMTADSSSTMSAHDVERSDTFSLISDDDDDDVNDHEDNSGIVNVDENTMDYDDDAQNNINKVESHLARQHHHRLHHHVNNRWRW